MIQVLTYNTEHVIAYHKVITKRNNQKIKSNYE